MNNLGKITIITPPDKLFNLAPSFLMVCPSLELKQELQKILSKSIEEVNIFIYEQDDIDVDWLLSVAHMVDAVILDIDNCSDTTLKFISFLLAMPNTHYFTTDEITPYKLISKNRIYDLNWMVVPFIIDDEEDDDN